MPTYLVTYHGSGGPPPTPEGQQQAMAAMQPPPGAATPGTPQAQPLPAPQSDLVPNAPGIGAA